jgi:hypothetical protein
MALSAGNFQDGITQQPTPATRAVRWRSSMKRSSIALLAILMGVGQLTGCASTGATPAGDTESSAATAGDTSTEPATTPADKKPTGDSAAEPECD